MPRRLIRWASRYVGNRGVVLFTLGFMWVVYGLGIISDQSVQVSLAGDLPEDWFPWWLRGLYWIVPGLLAIGCAVSRRYRDDDDATAWALLMFPIAVRCASFGVTWFMDAFNFGKYQHFPRPWSGFVIFVAFLIMLDRNAAGLDRLPPPPPPRSRRNRNR